MKTSSTFYSATNLGSIIRSHGLRQDWVAKQAGISAAHLSRLISGERLASEDVAKRLATVLRVDIFLAFDSPKGKRMSPLVTTKAAAA